MEKWLTITNIYFFIVAQKMFLRSHVKCSKKSYEEANKQKNTKEHKETERCRYVYYLDCDDITGSYLCPAHQTAH